MMRIFLILLFIFTGCSKSPLFNGEYDDHVIIRQTAEGDSYLGNLRFGLQWLSSPKSDAEGKVRVRFWDPKNATIYGPYQLPNKKFCAFLWMKMPDGSEHGSSPIKIKVEHNDDGDLYLLEELFFIMSGVWQLRLRLVDQNTQCKATKDFSFLQEAIVEVLVD